MCVVDIVVFFGLDELFEFSGRRVLPLQVNAKQTIIENFHSVICNDILQ